MKYDEAKSREKPHDPVFRNTFAPQCKSEWFSASAIFQGLKFGLFRKKDLPEEVYDGVQTYLNSKAFKETLV